MKQWKTIMTALFCLPVALALTAQEDRKPAYQPEKEHQLLKQFDGEWDFKSKCMVPGEELRTGQGVEAVRLTHGSFWLEIEDRGTVMGKDFSGRGLIGYDPAAKKYVGIWVDNWVPFMARFEGEADASGKVFTFQMTSNDPKTGKPSADQIVFEFQDADHRTMKYVAKDDAGKVQTISEITYTRKASLVK